jgi:uncharacterized protein YecE (DUF72 family)
MPEKAYIGTSGWNYKSWRDGFYSRKLSEQKQELGRRSSCFELI